MTAKEQIWQAIQNDIKAGHLRLCTDEEHRARETEMELKLRLEMVLSHNKTVTDRLSTLEKTFFEFLKSDLKLDDLIVLRRVADLESDLMNDTVWWWR